MKKYTQEKNFIDAASVASVFINEEILIDMKEHTQERSLLNVTSVASVLIKQEF